MAGVLSDGSSDGMMFKLRQGPFSKGYYRFALYGHTETYAGAFYELLDSAQQRILLRGRVEPVEKDLLAIACLDLQQDIQEIEIRVYARQGIILLVTQCVLKACLPLDVRSKYASDSFLLNV